jgi:NAD(P)-dependent dehydrogenase (short-subunit alcohol dehydrogenase family)
MTRGEGRPDYGGARGIGFAVASQLHERGASIVIVDLGRGQRRPPLGRQLNRAALPSRHGG